MGFFQAGLLECVAISFSRGSRDRTWVSSTADISLPIEPSVMFSRSVVSDSLRPHGWQAHQASLSITNSWSFTKLISIELVMPSNHLILCHPLLLPPSIFPSIRVFSNESVLRIRWRKYWSFSFNISSSNEYSGLISFSYAHYLYVIMAPPSALTSVLNWVLWSLVFEKGKTMACLKGTTVLYREAGEW